MPSPTVAKFEASKHHIGRKVWKSGEEGPIELWAKLSGKEWKGFE
jgi:hypothetical protein